MIEKVYQAYVFTFRLGTFSWASKEQNCVAQSSVEAEYVTTAKAVIQTIGY